MKTGFMYLMAVIDLHSRYVLHYSLSNSMSAEWCAEVLQEIIEVHGVPEIFNTDQGSQFTSEAFVKVLTDNEIKMNKLVISTILLCLTIINCMAQTQEPKVLFEQKNINELLTRRDSTEIRLREVCLYAPTNLNKYPDSRLTETDEEFYKRNIEFTIFYRYDERRERSGGSSSMAVAYFSNDSNSYKIYHSEFLEDLYYLKKSIKISDDAPDTYIPIRISFEPAFVKCVCVGNSDDERLLSVKVWKYIRRNFKEKKNKEAGKTH